MAQPLSRAARAQPGRLDEVAEFLNLHFICIKVDREQRPDVDALYMNAVAALGAQTGWPLTVFLTPQLEPFYGLLQLDAQRARPVLGERDGQVVAAAFGVSSQGEGTLDGRSVLHRRPTPTCSPSMR